MFIFSFVDEGGMVALYRIKQFEPFPKFWNQIQYADPKLTDIVEHFKWGNHKGIIGTNACVWGRFREQDEM